MFQYIKIIFLGLLWSRADIYYCENEGINFQQKINPVDFPDQSQRASLNKILGIEIKCTLPFKERLIEFLSDIQLGEVVAFYFVAKKKHQVSIIVDIVEELSLGEVELYGIDPDCFFSLVPLTNKNSKIIEKYILNLKTDFSLAGRMKQMIKNLLVDMGLSDRLYEGFVVTVQRM